MSLTPRDKRVILLGAAFLVAAALLRFGLMPLVGWWREARADSARHATALADIDRRATALGAMHTRLKPIYGDAIEKPLLNINATQIEFHKTVLDLLSASGIAYQSIQPQSPRKVKAAPDIVIVGLRVTGMCQLPQLTKCLTEMRNASRLVIVERVDVTADPKKPQQLSVTLSLLTPAETPDRSVRR